MAASSDIRRKAELAIVAALKAALPDQLFLPSRGGDDSTDSDDDPVASYSTVEITEAEKVGTGTDLTWQMSGELKYVSAIDDTTIADHSTTLKAIYDALAAIAPGYVAAQDLTIDGLEITQTSDFDDEKRRGDGDIIGFLLGCSEAASDGAVRYQFGFGEADAPVIDGFAADSAELRWEGRSYQALDFEGEPVSVVVSRAEKRKLVGTFTGKLQQGYNPATIANRFPFEDRFFLVRGISRPRLKGKFVVLTLEVESWPNIAA